MKLSPILISASLVVASLAPGGVLAQGRGNGGGHSHWKDARPGAYVRPALPVAQDCPPGLAKKFPPCVPPGQVGRSDDAQGNRVGDVLRLGDYIVIRDPSRYDLAPGSSWDYYRDDRHIYRVDRDTRKILAILDLVRALAD